MFSGKPSLSQVENAFQPAKEVLDVERFAGRKKPVQDAFFALLGEGSNIAVVGNRGIGKTSLARQIQNFGSGNTELLRKLKLEDSHKFDFQVMYLACGKEIQDKDALLARLLTSEACLGSWLFEIPKTRKMLHSISPKLSGKIFGTGLELGGTRSAETTTERVPVPLSIEGVFESAVRNLIEEEMTRDGLLIVVDEFDQINDPSGMASFLKALATNTSKVKFCLVGVAKDIQDLMKDHESADRLFAGSIVTLQPMSETELSDIITIAEKQVSNYFLFTAEARLKLIGLAQGHPYLVHLIGKFALRHAWRMDKRSIDDRDIETVLQNVASEGGEPVLEGRYRKAVASSAQRETVLKALAAGQDSKGEVWTTTAYKTALDGGVDNPSQYVGQLVTEGFGAEIENVRERYYRFKDSLFAAYVRARPSMRGLSPSS